MTDRKARLAALAAKAGRTKSIVESAGEQEQQHDTEATSQQQPQRSLKFRNYTPADPSLEAAAKTSTDDAQGADSNKRARLTSTSTDEQEENGVSSERTTAPASVAVADNKSALERALEKARAEAAAPQATQQKSLSAPTSDNHNNKPKKINWDLKRAIQPKLDKLEKRTQKAIVALLKERLEKEAAEAEGDGGDDID